MNDTFTFAIPVAEMARLIGADTGTHPVTITFGDKPFIIGDYVFTGAAIDAINGTALVTLKKQAIEQASNVTPITAQP